MDTNKVLHFVSGNKKKFEEIVAILKPELPNIEIKMINIDLPELQGEPAEIVEEKLKIALEKAEGPLIVEDTSLCFNALEGLPGPYIKHFMVKLKPEGLYKMLSSFDDKGGYAQCIFGLAKNKDSELKIFTGQTQGTIVYPRGPNNFGWDPIFQPENHNQTYAEMDKDLKNSLSHRSKALSNLIKFIKENPNYL